MAIAAWAGYAIFRIFQKFNAPHYIPIFLCAFTSDLVTYLLTSGQLAAAFTGSQGSFPELFLKFSGVFMITQIPLAFLEGLVTAYIYSVLEKTGIDFSGILNRRGKEKLSEY